MDKAISSIHQDEIKNDQLQDILDLVREMMGELHDTASMSAQLFELKITDEWADDIKETFRYPVKTSYDAYNAIEKSIRDMLQDQFEEFFKTKANLLDKAYLVSNNSLHYAIVLNDDTIDNEAEILEFKMDYDESPVARKFPLIISFPHNEHLENANLARELNIG